MSADDSRDEQYGETRQERRGDKLARRRARMRKHGAGLAQVYRNAVLKRLDEISGRKQPRKRS